MKTALSGLIEWAGRCVAWLVLFMAFVTFVLVVLRYGFGWGSIFWQESVIYMHALMFMVGLSYALKHDAHVRVDPIYSRLSMRGKTLVNLFGHLFFLIPTVLVIVVYSFDYVIDSWRILERSEDYAGIPAVYLLKSVIPIAAVLLLLQCGIEVSACVAKLRSQ